MELMDLVMEIAPTVLMAILTYVGYLAKNVFETYIKNKEVKEIVIDTVKFVEQKFSDLDSQGKFNTCKAKVLDYLASKGIEMSELELEILIESAVNGLKQGMTQKQLN